MKKASQIAKAFLKLSQPEAGDAITNLKLQKLLYYAQGFHIAIHNKPLFKENLLAWEHGPVVKEVYGIYSGFSSESIPVPEEKIVLTKKEQELVSSVWKVYGQFSAWRLREMSHNESPWISTERNKIISHKKLSDFFKTQLVDNE